MSVQRLGANLLTFDDSKLYGPHGIGVLYEREIPLRAVSGWVGREKGLKSGIENTQAIIGLAQAVSLVSTQNSKISILP